MTTTTPCRHDSSINARSHAGDFGPQHGRLRELTLIVLNDPFQRGTAVKVLDGITTGEHTERSLILDLALALAEDRRRDIVTKTKNGLESARARGRVGGRRPVVDDDKQRVILARRAEDQSIREIAVAVKVSGGVVHKTLNLAAAPGDS
ncbi:hypothetical protein ACIQI8_42315 [Streptomyces sp. NPDC092369]|uniref:hypothetical protein n=1 Tax=Streptomyces sp. NPDC092369 TaxID=3366015 RepID=UPI0037F8936A